MAWMEDTVQEGSAGAGPVSIAPYVAAMNTYYANTGASTDIFLPRNARRTGSVTVSGKNYSTFAPDDSFRTVVPTVGGISLYDALSPNSKVFTLPRPVLYPRGVSLGMFLNMKDQVAFNEMTAAFSITQGLGLQATPVATVPPAFTPFGLIPAGFPSTAAVSPNFIEQTKDLSPVNANLAVRTDEVIYKWGDLYIGIGAIGDELTENQYQMVARNQQSVTDVLNGSAAPAEYPLDLVVLQVRREAPCRRSRSMHPYHRAVEAAVKAAEAARARQPGQLGAGSCMASGDCGADLRRDNGSVEYLIPSRRASRWPAL